MRRYLKKKKNTISEGGFPLTKGIDVQHQHQQQQLVRRVII